MLEKLGLLPVAASTHAGRVDALYFFLLTLSAFFAILIATLIVVFAIKYRRRSEDEVPKPIEGSLALELTWSIIPFGISMGIFLWGAQLFVSMRTPPKNALDVFVVGRQWIVEGAAPRGPARDQRAARAGRSTGETDDDVRGRDSRFLRAGVSHQGGRRARALHRGMVRGDQGRCLPSLLLAVLRNGARKYDRPDRRHGAGGLPGLAERRRRGERERVERSRSRGDRGRGALPGSRLCHLPRRRIGRAWPALAGVFGSKVHLQSGETIVADESYLRESILNPQAKIVAGYQPVMPTFKGQVSEENLLQLITYIKTLRGS